MTINISSPNIPGQLSSVRLASTINLAGLYNNGPSNNGVNSLLVNNGSFAALQIDSTPVSLGDRVLLVGQSNLNEDGIYFVKAIGSASSSWILQRANDYQSIEQLKSGQYISVGDGTTNIGKLFVLEAPLPAQIGVSQIIFAEIASGGGGGEAANKDVTDNSQPLVASISGSFVVGNFISANDTSGTSVNSGISATNPSNPLVASVSGAFVAGHAISAIDTIGTIKDASTVVAVPSSQSQPNVASVTPPSTIGHIAVFSDTLGSIIDGGALPTLGTAAAKNATNNSNPDVASVNGAFVVGHSITSSDTLGTIEDSGFIITTPSNVSISKVSSVIGSPIVGSIVVFNDTNGSIQEGGIAGNVLLTSPIAAPDISINIVGFNVNADFSMLATAGKVNLVTASNITSQYIFQIILLNAAGTSFSGIGGDRDLVITDGTTVYSTILAANLQTMLSNQYWGSTLFPFPDPIAASLPSVAGANLYLQYSGGTTDYTAGSISFYGTAQRIV